MFDPFELRPVAFTWRDLEAIAKDAQKVPPLKILAVSGLVFCVAHLIIGPLG